MQVFIRSVPYQFNFIKLAVFPALLAYLLFSFFSLFQAINIPEGIFGSLRVSLFVILIVLSTLIFIHYEKAIDYLCKSVILSSAILSLIGACQYYNLAFTSIPGNVVPYATMANKNFFASALFLTLPLIIYGVSKSSLAWKWLGILTIVLTIFNIILTQTRTVWIALSLSILVIVFILIAFNAQLNIFKLNFQKTFFRRILFLGIIISGVVIFFLSINGSFHSASMKERITLWSKTNSMIYDHPFSGVGIGNWKIVMPKYGLSDLVIDAQLGKMYYQTPENDFYSVISETGIGGLISYLLIFLFVIYYLLKILFHSQSTSNTKIFTLSMLFGITGYMIIAFFSSPMQQIFHMVLLAFIISAVVTVYYKSFSVKEINADYLLPLFLMVSFPLLIFSIVIGLLHFNAERHTRKAWLSKSQNDFVDVIDKADKAYTPLTTLDPTATPLHFYRGIANFSLDKIEEARIDFETAYKYHPNHIHVLNNLATCYETSGYHDKAIEYYQRCIQISPKFTDALINLCLVYYNMQDYKKAHEIMISCHPLGAAQVKKLAAIKAMLYKKLGY